MNRRDHNRIFPPPCTIREETGEGFTPRARLHLMTHTNAACAESFCRGFSIATRIGDPSIIGRLGTPLLLLPADLADGAYRMSVRSECIRVEASSPAGFQYAGTALGVLMDAPDGELAACSIEDAPAFPVRGVMLDVSRDKVPTMDTLFRLVDQLAAWRFNHLQLYTEHTFAYTGHERAWKDASPLTADEIRRLDDYCAMLNIELAPNQNSFGHLQRWLKHPEYRHLAESPDGYITPWGERRTQPFSLNPLLPESLAFLSGLYDELLPNFSSHQFNIGGDETFDLGQGASKAACEARGKGRVYLDFLLAIKRLVEQRGRRMLFWGDIVLNHPELIPELGSDLTALVWGYEADHPFDDQCRRFADSGIPYWVCPGTSNWNSIAGRLDNALANMDAAAHAGRAHGAGGFLVTEWGDNGHWQTMPFMLIGLAAGAWTAWHGQAPEPDDLSTLFPEAGAATALGHVYRAANYPLHNASPVFSMIRYRDIPPDLMAGWSTATCSRVRSLVGEALALLPASGDATMTEEVHLAARMLSHAMDRTDWLMANRPAGPAASLAEDITGIRETLQRLWLARNRPGGFADSLVPLDMRLAEYLAAR